MCETWIYSTREARGLRTSKQFSCWLKWAQWMNKWIDGSHVSVESRVFENDFIASNKMRWSLSVVSLFVMNLLITPEMMFIYIFWMCTIALDALWSSGMCHVVASQLKNGAHSHDAKWKSKDKMWALVCLELLLYAKQRLQTPSNSRKCGSVCLCDGGAARWRRERQYYYYHMEK